MTVRVVFLDDGSGEARRAIAAALASGMQAGPAETVSRWELMHDGAAEPTADELRLARRLARG